MFIKKYVKEGNIYYKLVLIELTNQDKPHYINMFIPEALANMLVKLGVNIDEVKTKNSK